MLVLVDNPKGHTCELCEKAALVSVSVDAPTTHYYCRAHLRTRLFERIELAASMWRVGR